ncbi:PDDEXK nuclease domain-containing protein [Streptomyces sp. HNM0663]|uniref:PDDEXK nuclease domain-containing protein n=1 Tax=Streptomyces chengmaiensis TaxID=3040919 RepID=A0ABT6HVK3_9ACTN|nr:PDDEXK nuclease domain-containing protein [Streptomyces chengmaiensis]MDH2392744.1 PDDEXK nuclease domain-containing protein [Streptomyces chengmaiensis]
MSHTNERPDSVSWYEDLLNEVKETVASPHARSRTETYWEIGRCILRHKLEADWRTKAVDRLSADLRTAFPRQRGFSRRNLLYMQQMARAWPEPIAQEPVARLPWGHITVLVTHLKTRSELDFYATAADRHGWTRATLQRSIAQRLHISRSLADTLATSLVRFLTELGLGFAFVGRRHPVTIRGEKFHIDLLFYHLKLRRYVIFELRTNRPTRHDDTGKLGFYLELVDHLIRDPDRDETTLGLQLNAAGTTPTCRIALRGRTHSPAVNTYAALPPRVRTHMPTEADLLRLTQSVLDEHP